MKTLKKCALIFLAIVLLLPTTAISFGDDYTVDELRFSIDLPDSWTVCTKTNYQSEFIKALGYQTDEDWIRFMNLNGFYMYAKNNKDSELQYEIYVSSSTEFNEDIDYTYRFDWELNQIAKASFKENNEDKTNKITFNSYEVVKGSDVNGANTKYIVFDYTGVDNDGNSQCGKLYHTVENGVAIDFDLSCYSKQLGADYEAAFDNAVLNVKYEKTARSFWTFDARTKQTLVYVALIILAIAFVSVIIIYIVSNSKERKNAQEAEKARLEAEKNMQQQQNNADNNENNDNNDTTTENNQ